MEKVFVYFRIVLSLGITLAILTSSGVIVKYFTTQVLSGGFTLANIEIALSGIVVLLFLTGGLVLEAEAIAMCSDSLTIIENKQIVVFQYKNKAAVLTDGRIIGRKFYRKLLRSRINMSVQNSSIQGTPKYVIRRVGHIKVFSDLTVSGGESSKVIEDFFNLEKPFKT